MTELFESKPRWLGSPKICLSTNHLSFHKRQDLLEFIERYCPGARKVRIGRCSVCGMIHFACKHRGPSGDSSGSSKR